MAGVGVGISRVNQRGMCRRLHTFAYVLSGCSLVIRFGVGLDWGRICAKTCKKRNHWSEHLPKQKRRDMHAFRHL
jgi:hypothetical protein